MIDFHTLYERYSAPLYRFAVVLTGNRAEAEDVVADAFVRLWASPGAIREATVKAYLFTIVRNLCLKRWRAQGRFVALSDSLPDTAVAVDQRTVAAADLARVKQLMAGLPAADRAAVMLRASQCSYEEIGDALGVTPGAARVRVHRTRLLLAKGIERTS